MDVQTGAPPGQQGGEDRGWPDGAAPGQQGGADRGWPDGAAPAGAAPSDAARLHQLIRRLMIVTWGFVAVEVAAFALSRDVARGILALLIAAYGVALAFARALLRRGALAESVVLVGAGALALGFGAVLIVPYHPTVGVMVPLLVAAIVLPYLAGEHLRRLVIACWLTVVASALLIELLPPAAFGPPWLDATLRVASLGAAAGFILILLWQFSTRLRETVDQTRAANVELRAARDRLAGEQGRLRFQAELLDQLEVAVIATDADGSVTHWNRRAEGLFGWKRDEALGRRPRELTVPPEDEATALAIRDRLLAGERWEGEFRTRRKDGSTFPAYFTAAPLRDAGGRVAGMIGAAVDLSERRRVEEAVRQAERLEGLRDLTAGVAHDFNNLLAAIMGNASLALLDLPPEAPARGNMEEIEGASRRAAELVERMLAFAGRELPRPVELDLAELVGGLADRLATLVGRATTLRYRHDEGTPRVLGDAAQIGEVVAGLVANAAEAIGEGAGVISVATGLTRLQRDALAGTLVGEQLADGDYASLEVADTGSGMDEATRRRAFDPFFSTRFLGRGLGLAAALGIVLAHHGAIVVESAPGRGSTFRILLPPGK